ATSVLVGMQPVLTQVPPKRCRSMMATRKPAPASRCASDGPAWPVPITMASKLDMAALSSGTSLREHQLIGGHCPRRVGAASGNHDGFAHVGHGGGIAHLMQDTAFELVEGAAPRRRLNGAPGAGVASLPAHANAGRAEVHVLGVVLR